MDARVAVEVIKACDVLSFVTSPTSTSDINVALLPKGFYEGLGTLHHLAEQALKVRTFVDELDKADGR